MKASDYMRDLIDNKNLEILIARITILKVISYSFILGYLSIESYVVGVCVQASLGIMCPNGFIFP